MVYSQFLVAAVVGACFARAIRFQVCSPAEFAQIRRSLARVSSLAPDAQRELARYGTLAASNHNSQPWRFRLPERGIVVLPEFGRQGPVEDYDGHELFVSLGCAVENIEQAADAFGFRAATAFDARSGGMARVTTLNRK